MDCSRTLVHSGDGGFPVSSSANGRNLAHRLPAVPASPLITVCITNRNYGRYLAAAIETVFGQTYPNVELVVVDDGSTDDSREVIERYGDRLATRFQNHAGQAAAGWTGAEAATGDVVIFLDADDLLHPGICARVAAAFGQQPDLSLVQWRLQTVDIGGRAVGRLRPPRPGLLPSGDLSEHVLRVRNWHYQLTSGVAYAGWVVRRLLPASLPEGEYGALDQWLNEQAPLLGPIRSLDDVGTFRRIHGSNYTALAGSSSAWPRRMIRLTVNSHEHVHRLASELGRSYPEDARDLPDPAFYSWLLWSLTADPELHPYPADRRVQLAHRGISATVRHPHFPRRHRVKRAVWFALVGALPRSLARQVIEMYKPDGPPSTS
jgi:glycosyltransferase involved in cell wall biosynthesis